ncbi:Ribose transport system ATP-binding protein [Arthrobacter sp. 9V]|uniref:sugar ABC transporter ATP-binding protein n=1 Tax=Arthrobacter sp. 9V TaxID=2653132 RepID=UPI0012F0B17C|nr:sugar ABC transporter ATP-binding protein [Arthrobacter sp. 9V]VXB52003.1 Ribose transport system ATP-binding protein [Arthrobacter sp. 9V]
MTGQINLGLGDALTSPTVALGAKTISKTYGGTRALNEVSIGVSTGAIHALMGGNGSGKSTFIKVMAGIVTADQGHLAFGREWSDARSHTPARAKAAGLHFVHQQNSIFPDLTVAENLALSRGFELTAMKSISWRAQMARARDVLQRFEINVAPETPMDRLSAATQMMVAIARALQDQDDTAERGVLVLDEPTASLPKHEVDLLLDALRRYAADGQTIIYVSHRLDEVTAIADEATVLRNGRVAARLFGAEITHDALVSGITGVVVGSLSPTTAPPKAPEVSTHGQPGEVPCLSEPVLTLRRSAIAYGEVSDALVLRKGEIVAVAGLLGSGRSRLLKQIFGVVPRKDLQVVIGSQPLAPSKIRDAMKCGIGLVPEDRLHEAAFPDLSIADNLSISCLSGLSRFGWISPSRERQAANKQIEEFAVVAPNSSTPLIALSGGNQQKVMLARWMQRRPKVLLLDEPTQGVDIGARNEIHDLVRAAAAAGTAVLVISSDFDELAALAHRAVVVSDGNVVSAVDGPLTEENLTKSVYAQEKAL